MNYYISDLHLFHENIIQFDNRPFTSVEEMNSAIVNKWNDVVTNGDTVYILGDISMRSSRSELISLVATLKGRKILIKGNHDDVSDLRYAQLFTEICDYKEIKDNACGKNLKLVLSHYPIFSWNGMQRGDILLYGHTHMSKEDEHFQNALRTMPAPTRPVKEGTVVRAINVGCMKPYMNYTPRTLKELLDNNSDI